MSTSNSKGRKNSTKRALSAAGIKRSLPRFYKRHPQARRAINAAAASACILAVIGGSSLLANILAVSIVLRQGAADELERRENSVPEERAPIAVQKG